MKKFALLLSLVFVGGLAVAQEAKTADKAMAKAEKAMSDKTHEVATEVVSVDTAKHTITLKGEKENMTVPVEGKALASLETTKAGDKVTVTCHDDDKGAHLAVVEIKATPAEPPK